MFQDVHEDDTSHVGVIGSLVIVREQGLSIIVAALVLCVKAPAQVVLKLVVIYTLFVDLAKRSVVKCLGVVGQNFCVVGIRKSRVPFLGEL